MVQIIFNSVDLLIKCPIIGFGLGRGRATTLESLPSAPAG